MIAFQVNITPESMTLAVRKILEPQYQFSSRINNFCLKLQGWLHLVEKILTHIPNRGKNHITEIEIYELPERDLPNGLEMLEITSLSDPPYGENLEYCIIRISYFENLQKIKVNTSAKKSTNF